MKKGLVIGLVLGAAGGVAAGAILAMSHRQSPPSRASSRSAELRFSPFRSRVRIRFDDSAEFIKPAI